MTVAIVAALAMFVQDVIGTVMVMSEAKNRGWLAGVLDSAGWLVGITTTTIAVTALNGHDTGKKIAVVVLVSVANLFGTKTGQVLGHRFVKDATTLSERLDRLESLVNAKNHT